MRWHAIVVCHFNHCMFLKHVVISLETDCARARGYQLLVAKCSFDFLSTDTPVNMLTLTSERVCLSVKYTTYCCVVHTIVLYTKSSVSVSMGQSGLHLKRK